MEMLKKVWKLGFAYHQKEIRCLCGWFQWSREKGAACFCTQPLQSALQVKGGHGARSRVSLTPCIGSETSWQHWKVSFHT